MPMSRFSGGRSVMSSSLSRTRPASGNSKPATQRSVVVLPQPLGPSSEMNSPSTVFRSRCAMAGAVLPAKVLRRPSSDTRVVRRPSAGDASVATLTSSPGSSGR